MVGISRRELIAAFASSGCLVALSAKAQSLGETWYAPVPNDPSRWVFLKPAEVRFLIAATDRLIPQDDFPSASQAGVVDYIDLQLATDWGKGAGLYLKGPFRPQEAKESQGYQLRFTPAELYRHAIGHITREIERPFETLSADEQDGFLRALEQGEITLGEVPGATFFDHLHTNTREGYFADPVHGGNFGMIGWRMVGFPGASAYYTDTVDRHGMAYFRPPSGVTGVASGRVGDGATAAGGPQRVRLQGRGG